MKKFEELDKRDAKYVNQDILKKWKSEDILAKTIQNRENNKTWVFYDGPIYANAKPGIHHVLAKTIKDSFCKYKTMQGYKVLRKIGLDTHGLPIEVNVEKKLGFKTKADIEKFGIENFCKECNKATALNIDEINDVTDLMGQFIDCENPYITCSNNFIESEWWLLKEMDKKGVLYHGEKVLPYCPRCGTELSANEVSQEYHQDSVNTVIVPFKVVGKDEYFLVWTTTPWTLIANVALCVNPDLTYLTVKSMGYKFIVAETLADKVLGEDYEVIEKTLGKDLVGTKYEQLLPFVKVEGKAFEVLSDSYVTDSDGTGIVHIAPAFGEDDNRVSRENGITFINPVGKDGCYTEGPWANRLVTDPELEIEIIKYLKENDKLFKKIKLTHDYPHCWRCKSPLIYYAKPAWYIRTTQYKDEIIKANKSVNWYPEYVGTKRFNNWLENMVDWGISRNRYWGCPMPIWICDKCSCKHVIGSLDELQSMVVENINVRNLELHRPYIDNVHLKCPECGGVMSRVSDVMDVWFDSGAMPYGQYHYPFENKELFEAQFPADFIAEGVDQTRGWFNSLICISTIVSGVSSFKNVVVNDMVLDGFGKKMSKSVGNIIDPIKELNTYGADVVRWYMLYASPVWTPLKYDSNGCKEVHSKFFNPLKNTYSFFQMYANADNIDPREYNVLYEDLDEIDKWLLSKYERLVKYVTDSYEEFDLNKVTKAISNFVSEDLSNWYIRRNRRRFWKSEEDTSKRAVYQTTYQVLCGVCKLIAPIVPFISEEMYTKLTLESSVHLSDFPKYDESMVNDYIETRMDKVRNIISLGRNAREDSKIKVRIPIKEAIINGKDKKLIGDLLDLIKEELNVKDVLYTKSIATYMNFVIKPNFKVVGKMFGKDIKAYQALLENLSDEEKNKLNNKESITVKFLDNDLEINADMVDIRINAKEGFDVAMDNNDFIILDTKLSEDLILEGLARELVSKVQNLRKLKDFDIQDRIKLYISGDVDIDKCLSTYEEFIKNETLTLEIVKEIKGEAYDINDHETYLDVERV